MRKLQLFLIPLLLLSFIGVKAQSIIYVDANIPTSKDGSSWSRAFNNLQTAIDNATKGDTIWVRWGTYKPTKSYNNSADPRTKSFILKDDIKIYGGFLGFESSLSQRFLASNRRTYLNGDIGVANDSSDNVYHVVMGLNVDSVLFDGLTISYGNADTTIMDAVGTDSVSRAYGGGLYIDSSSIELNWVEIEMNHAKVGGAGMNLKNSTGYFYQTTFQSNNIKGNGFNSSNGKGGGGAMININSSPIIENCRFNNNKVYNGGRGGAIYNLYSNSIFNNVVIGSNYTTAEGGGMYNENSNVIINDGQFGGNTANGGGGAMKNDSGSITLTNLDLTTNSTSGNGGAIQNWKSNLNMKMVSFSYNIAFGNGGAIASYNNCTSIMNRITFEGNTGKRNGGAIYNERNSHAIITNTLIWKNRVDKCGGGIYTKARNSAGNDSSSVILTNVTITKNRADSTGGGLYDDGAGNSKIRNSIIYSNKTYSFYGKEDADIPSSMITNAVSYSIIGNKRYTTGTTIPTTFSNIHFIDSVKNDFRLDSLSPAIDNGDSSVYDTAATPNISSNIFDFRGGDRLMGVNVDIGAYEKCDATTNATVQSLTYTQLGNQIIFTATPSNGGRNPTYIWYINNRIEAIDTINQLIAYNGSGRIIISNNDWVAVKIKPIEACILRSAKDSVQVVITGIDENKTQNNQFSLYPNPNNGSFTIANNSEKTEVLSYTITDLTGRELYREENKSNTQTQQIFQLDLSNGLYFLTVTNQKGERKSLKFMVSQ